MATNELKFNLKDATGKDRFISPTCEVIAGDKVKKFTGNLGLQLGYICKSYAERSYNQATMLNAGSLFVQGLQDALNKDAGALVKLYMPTKYEDRESEDLSKWTLCATLPVSDLVTVAGNLANTNQAFTIQAMTPAEVKEHYPEGLPVNLSITPGAWASLPVNTCDITQPVYYTPGESAPVAKTGKGKSPIRLSFD